jgi:colanic acid biosynthesis glycosyl transferase WcaI
VFSTSPPLIGIVGITIASLRAVPVAYWAMDLNPDQLVALGKIGPTNPLVRLLELANRLVLRRSALIVALDPLMADRIRARRAHRHAIVVIPPWSPVLAPARSPRAKNEFRLAHGLTDGIVLMYSGNHSTSNPLTTVLEAAVVLQHEAGLKFVFVGSGAGKREVESYIAQHRLANVLSLPYQPRELLPASLSAADVHIVSLGNGMAGIIHPCKVYGAMSVARPLLYLGPSPSHVSQLVEQDDLGWCVEHGDVAAMVTAIREIVTMPPSRREAMGERGRAALERDLAAPDLCGQLCDAIETRLLESRGHGNIA